MANRTKVHKGIGAPTFCWHCNNHLRFVKGWGGPMYFVLVIDEIGHTHRVHADCVAGVTKDYKVKVKA